MTHFDEVCTLVRDAILQRAFPAAVVEVGMPDGMLWRRAFGTLTYEPGSPPAQENTLFDLASLTKVIAATTLAMKLTDAGRFSLDDPVACWVPAWRGTDREVITVGDLLSHSSGLPAHLPLYAEHRGRAAYERAIAARPLEYAPRTRAIYSDLGFILLGFVLERVAGAGLAEQFDALDLPDMRFGALAGWPAGVAPTRQDEWRGRLLIGEVDDNNAWALGGVAAHAGLFGTAEAVGRFARLMLRTYEGTPLLAQPGTVRVFVTRTDVPDSSRALGWDTMLPSASCGTRMSARAFGHTGFTGTSVWIDPDRRLYVVFLTNRVHPSAENNAIRQVRPALHDAVIAAVSP